MAQSALNISPVSAMARALGDIGSGDISVEPLGQLEDNTILRAPFQEGRKIILDLTPGEDAWLNVLEVNAGMMPHHEGHETQCLHMAVQLDGVDYFKLEAIERKIQKAFGYSVIHNAGKTWYGMHHGEGKVILNLVLANSQSPTSLIFIQGGVMKEGVGKAFLDECLAGDSLKDFYCKAKVGLEFIHETGDSISVVLRVHSTIFTPVLKCTIVQYSAAEKESCMRASKRLKYVM